MATAKSTRKRRRPAPVEYWDDDLATLDPDSPFTKMVRELRAFVAGLGKPLDQWDKDDSAEFRRRAEGNSLAVALALAASGGPEGVTSENPHRPPRTSDHENAP
jgi:hypothetical protein